MEYSSNTPLQTDVARTCKGQKGGQTESVDDNGKDKMISYLMNFIIPTLISIKTLIIKNDLQSSPKKDSFADPVYYIFLTLIITKTRLPQEGVFLKDL